MDFASEGPEEVFAFDSETPRAARDPRDPWAAQDPRPKSVPSPQAAPRAGLPSHVRDALLDAARVHGGACLRGAWMAVTDFQSAWRTAFFAIEVPDEVVCHVDDFREYVWALHMRLAMTYKRHDMPLPVWRSWDALARRWPELLG